MKQWLDDSTPQYDEIIEPLLKAVPWAIAYDCGVKVAAFDYDGFDTPSTAYICVSPDEALTPEYLEHSGQSALDAVLNIVFRLGYEQGVRTTRKSDRIYKAIERALEKTEK